MRRKLSCKAHTISSQKAGGRGDTGALIQPPSPQFGDSAAAESGRLRRFHSPGSGEADSIIGRRGSVAELFYRLLPSLCRPPPHGKVGA